MYIRWQTSLLYTSAKKTDQIQTPYTDGTVESTACPWAKSKQIHSQQ